MWATVAILILSAGAASAADFIGLIKQGRASIASHDTDAAQAAYDQACTVGPTQALPLSNAGLCEHGFATLAEARGHDEDAASHYLKALADWRDLGPAWLRNNIVTLTNLGALYRRTSRLTDAETTLTRALDLVKTLPIPDPELHAIVLSHLGGLYGDLGQSDRARVMLNESITGLRSLTPPNPTELAWAYSSLGMLEIGDGHYKSGESDLRTAMELAQNSFGEASRETAAYATNLALALLVQGQFDRAGMLLRRARFVTESTLGPDSAQMVTVLAELTSVETGLGRFRIAEECGEKALSILSRQVPAGSPEIALTEETLGLLYLREHRIADAERILPSALESERRFFKDGRTLADGIRNLAALRVEQHAWNDAESLYREAIGLYERKLGVDHPDLAPVLRAYAIVLKHQGASKAQVRNVEARARSIGNSEAS